MLGTKSDYISRLLHTRATSAEKSRTMESRNELIEQSEEGSGEKSRRAVHDTRKDPMKRKQL